MTHFLKRTPPRLLAVLAAAVLGSLTWNLAARAEPSLQAPDYCWSVKTTICTDCAESDSKYCDPRAAEGPYVSCIQSLKEPCPGFTCSTVSAQTGPPCF